MVSHKFGQKSPDSQDGRDSVQTADSIEPRAPVGGVELFDERGADFALRFELWCAASKHKATLMTYKKNNCRKRAQVSTTVVT